MYEEVDTSSENSSVGDDNFDDFVINSPDNNDNDDYSLENTYEGIPTTNSGDNSFIVDGVCHRNYYVNGHVIMNQCGSLLNHQEKNHCGIQISEFFSFREFHPLFLENLYNFYIQSQ